jgi:hypothetical protein
LNAVKLAAISAVRVERVNLRAGEAVSGIIATTTASSTRVSRQSVAPQGEATAFSGQNEIIHG